MMRLPTGNLAVWCKNSNLSLNTDKTKELNDLRGHHTPFAIHGTPVKIVSSFRFLGVQISESFSWTPNNTCILKKDQQRWFFQKRKVSYSTLVSFYHCTSHNILTCCITV